MAFPIALASAAIVITLYFRLFSVPPDLRHLPRVPLLPLLWSYVTFEVDDRRFERLILPFVEDLGESVVLVWTLGRWMVHVLDYHVAKGVSDDVETFPKELPPDDLMLWRYTGYSNILFTNGEQWKRHSRVVRSALGPVPMALFTQLAKKLFAVMDPELDRPLQWDELAQRFSLDAVGESMIGHHFNAVEGDSPFMTQYNAIFHEIANPLYLLAPIFERIIPRNSLKQKIDASVADFQALLDRKRDRPGNDMMTFMLRNREMTNEELRDNMVVLFIAGHDTNAGALTSLVYYLAKHPEVQKRARAEALSVVPLGTEPTEESLKDMHYIGACIHESLRINTPVSYIVPRTSAAPARIGRHHIPSGTSILINIYAIHHHGAVWPDPYRYSPSRFLDATGKLVGAKVGWLPFALGVRQCPAQKFAMAEQRTLISMLLREYEWSLPKDNIHYDRIHNAPSPFALALPHDMSVCFQKRGQVE